MVDLNIAAQRLDKLQSGLEADAELSSDASKPVTLDQQSVGRLSRMDAMQQQAVSKAAEASRKTMLLRIEAAHRRIRDEDYGYCEECGEEIPDKRLEIDPTAERCVGCAA